MSINKEDIKKRLAMGASQDEIAEEITNILNNAVDEYKAEKAAEAAKEEMRQSINNIVATIYENVITYYKITAPSMDMSLLTVKDMREMLDKFADLYNVVNEISMGDLTSVFKIFD